MFVLALATGMREGELFALNWRDVDFETAKVTVRGTLVEVGGKLLVNEPKTLRSRRPIDLPTSTLKALLAHRQRSKYATGWVFRDTDGGPLRKSNFLRRDFKPLLAKAGLPATLHFHDLRHTHATLLLESGINPKVTQERLGHSRIATTLDTYSHVSPTMQLEAARTIGALLNGQKIRRRKAHVKSSAPESVRPTETGGPLDDAQNA